MTASANIKTPAMDVPLLCRPDAKQQGEHLKRYFTRVCLADVSPIYECVTKVFYPKLTAFDSCG